METLHNLFNEFNSIHFTGIFQFLNISPFREIFWFILLYIFILILVTIFGKNYLVDISILNDKVAIIFAIPISFDGDNLSTHYLRSKIIILDGNSGKIRLKQLFFKNWRSNKDYGWGPGICDYYSKGQNICKIDDLFWFPEPKFCTINPITLKINFGIKAKISRCKELKRSKIKEIKFNEIKNKVYVLTNTGNPFSYNIKTNSLTPENFNQEETILRKGKSETDTNIYFDKREISNSRYKITFPDNPVNNDHSFLKLQFLESNISRRDITCENPPSIFISYSDNLDKFSNFNIARFTNEGKLLWTISQKKLKVKHWKRSENPAEIKFAELNGNKLYILFKSRREKLVAINIETGKFLWQYKI